MNSIKLTGRLVAIRQFGEDEKRCANCLLAEYSAGKPVTYQVTFWKEKADYLMENSDKGDELEVSGYISGISSGSRGDFITIRGCELLSIGKVKRTAIDDTPTLLEKGAEEHGDIL